MTNRVTQVFPEIVVQDQGGGNRVTQVFPEVVVQDQGGQLQVGGVGIEVMYQVGIEGDAIFIVMED